MIAVGAKAATLASKVLTLAYRRGGALAQKDPFSFEMTIAPEGPANIL